MLKLWENPMLSPEARLDAASGEIDRLRSLLDRAEQTNAVLRRDLADPPGDIQELVLRKLGMWPPNAFLQPHPAADAGESGATSGASA